MRQLLGIVVLALICGCTASGHKTYYTQYIPIDSANQSQYIFLAEGEEPKIFYTDNLNADAGDGIALRAKGYVALGMSRFNGPWEGEAGAISKAKELGASVILMKANYAKTETRSGTILLPNTQTTTNSSNINANSRTPYGNVSTTGTVTGMSTTNSTIAVPYSNTWDVYNQEAIFLVKLRKLPRFGVHARELTPDDRARIEQNTGVMIDLVFDNSPAFYANVMIGDVLVSIDGNGVHNTEEGQELLRQIPESADKVIFEVIRNGEKKSLVIEL
jgi:hypothetical protein